MAGYADQLADRTGMGEAITGAILLGASTSIPGITASILAAADGFPAMALSNAFGGIAAQTAFLAIADITYRKVNLEHAAASLENMMQGSLLIALLGILFLALSVPNFSFWGIHPATPTLIIAYIAGIRLIYKSRENPMWLPRKTEETRVDIPDDINLKKKSLSKMWLSFIISAVLIITAGWFLTRSAEKIAVTAELNHSFVGAVLIAVTTSLPELVTSLAAVKRGALTLAVGGVLGGNVFDTLFAAMADIAYRDGSIYNSATSHEFIIIGAAVTMTSVLLMGLLRREKKGFANIGFESSLIIIIYIASISLINFY
jgi:cation:H+ antiporter